MKAIILVVLLLSTVAIAPKDAVKELDDFLIGFFQALNVTLNITEIETCLTDGETLWANLLAVLNYVKTIDFKNIQNLFNAIDKIIPVIQDIMKAVRDCTAAHPEVTTIIDKIMTLDIKKRYPFIIQHAGKLVQDLDGAVRLLKEKPINVKSLGLIIGDMFYIIAISDS